MAKVAVGLSGGVDSATALYLLKKAGHEVIAVFTDYFDCSEKSGTSSCCAPGGLRRARETASFLDVPFYRMDFKKQFRRMVMEPFTESYNYGRTPNPCIQCNSRLRFSLFLDRLHSMGIENFATGHYAALEGTRLFKAADKSKDQSYFLYAVKRERFKNVFFPLSGMNKEQVRSTALEKNLPAAFASESQDSCILSEKSLNDYMKKKADLNEGNIVDRNGKVLGKHAGYQNYTVGQRIRLGGMGGKLYVSRIVPSENRIVVLPRGEIYSSEVNFKFEPDVFFARQGENLRAKLRSTQKGVECSIEKLDLKQNICKIKFTEPVWGPAPGQSAVLYRSGEVVGGGEILK